MCRQLLLDKMTKVFFPAEKGDKGSAEPDDVKSPGFVETYCRLLSISIDLYFQVENNTRDPKYIFQDNLRRVNSLSKLNTLLEIISFRILRYDHVIFHNTKIFPSPRIH